MTEITALSELSDTGLASHADTDGHTHERSCLNCGTRLAGAYCHECGQRGHVHRTIAAFFHDLAHGVFHFEGKIWHTLPMLAWRPGELTRRYVAGERVRFVSPIALFLFTVFLMFAVVSTLPPIHLDGDHAASGMAESIAADRSKLAALTKERAAAAARSLPTAPIDARIKESTDDLRTLETMRQRGFIKGATVSFADGAPAFIRAPARKAAANPDLTLYKLKSSAYKWSWSLIPLSVPFLWLLFPFSRRYRLYDHTVFVTYSLSFMSMLVVALTLWSATGVPGVGVAALAVPPFHIYRQLKGAYSLGRASALLRTVLLCLAAAIVIMLFMTLMLALGILD